MGDYAVSVVYGCRAKDYEDEVLMTTKLFDTDEPEEHNEDRFICCHPVSDGALRRVEPYETGLTFLGIEVADTEFSNNEWFEGLPSISDELKQKVQDMYDNFPEEIKSRVMPPNWFFVAHYV